MIKMEKRDSFSLCSFFFFLLFILGNLTGWEGERERERVRERERERERERQRGSEGDERGREQMI